MGVAPSLSLRSARVHLLPQRVKLEEDAAEARGDSEFSGRHCVCAPDAHMVANTPRWVGLNIPIFSSWGSRLASCGALSSTRDINVRWLPRMDGFMGNPLTPRRKRCGRQEPAAWNCMTSVCWRADFHMECPLVSLDGMGIPATPGPLGGSASVAIWRALGWTR